MYATLLKMYYTQTVKEPNRINIQRVRCDVMLKCWYPGDLSSIGYLAHLLFPLR